MAVTYAVALAAALLLLASGAVTVARPRAATAALDALGVAVPGSGRVLGLGEIAVAAWFLASGGTVATLALGGAYVGFAGVVEVGRRRGLADCGCFGGTARTPPTRLHVVLTLTIGGLVLGTATGNVPTLAGAVDATPWLGLPLLGSGVLVAWLAHVALQVLTAMPARGAGPAAEGPRLFALTGGSPR